MDQFANQASQAFGGRVFKKVEVNQGNVWDWNTQKSVEGSYQGNETKMGKFGEYTLYFLKTDKGEVISVKAKAQIKNFFQSVAPGTYVKITFMGKGVSSKGNPVNNFQFEVAE